MWDKEQKPKHKTNKTKKHQQKQLRFTYRQLSINQMNHFYD